MALHISLLREGAMIGAVTTLATLGFSGMAQALIVVPTDLNPGDQYRLMFVTDSTTDAISDQISYYNDFVRNDVTGSQLATDLSLAGLTTTWFAIASTASISARDNTGTQGTGGVPIYLITGERVADHYGDLWDGSIQTAIDTTPNSLLYESIAWTGTDTNGSQFFELGNLGGSSGGARSYELDGNWIFHAGFTNDDQWTLYGISSVLEVASPTATTPEPSSFIGFITLGGLMLGRAVRRRRK